MVGAGTNCGELVKLMMPRRALNVNFPAPVDNLVKGALHTSVNMNI